VSLVDRLGRKILLGLGCLIMTFALIALAYGFWGWDDDVHSDYVLSAFKKQVILWAMFVYIAGYQVGFGPITWCVLSEIYPSQIRGQAMAFSVEVNFFCKFLCQLCFPIIQDFLGWGTTFAMFACIVVCSLFFIGTMVPETKGMSLEEIQVQMKLLYGSNKQPLIILQLPLQDSKRNPLLDLPPARGLTPIV
jgi:MFS family permease